MSSRIFLNRLILITLTTMLLYAFAVASLAQTTNTTYPPLQFKDRAQEVRFQKLAAQLRCLVCQDESLADSQADLAKQMRHLVFRQMQKGMTDEQIKQYLVDRYSEYVLYRPPLRPGTWLLWFGPAVIILFGAGLVVLTVRRRRMEAPHEIPEADDDDW